MQKHCKSQMFLFANSVPYLPDLLLELVTVEAVLDCHAWSSSKTWYQFIIC